MRSLKTLDVMRVTIPVAIASVVAAVLFWGCLGGTGTDTENGFTQLTIPQGVSARVVDGGGHPLRSVKLALYAPEYRPDSGFAQAPLTLNDKPLVSDSAGYVPLELRGGGKFVVEGARGDTTLFFDTLVVADVKATAAFTFRVRETKVFQGKVRLASGLKLDSAAVFIQGTARWVKVDSTGAYTLGRLPADAARMGLGIRYQAHPVGVKVVDQTTVKLDTAKVMPGNPPKDSMVVFSCKDITKDTVAKRILATDTLPRMVSAADPMGSNMLVTPTALDTGKLNAAIKSCDSIPSGTVVDVRVPTLKPVSAGQAADSVTVPYLVVKKDPAYLVPGGTNVYYLPYGDCLETPDIEKTTFNLQVQVDSTGSNILVTDVAGKCIKP